MNIDIAWGSDVSPEVKESAEENISKELSNFLSDFPNPPTAIRICLSRTFGLEPYTGIATDLSGKPLASVSHPTLQGQHTRYERVG